MELMTLKKVLQDNSKFIDQEVTLRGWIRNHRKQSTVGFIDFFDGTCFKSIQVVYNKNIKDFERISEYRNGSSVEVTGVLTKSENNSMTLEMHANIIKLEGDCPENYPLQPKKHSVEFLREISYLRPRTRLFQAIFRIRNVAAIAIHNYFQERDYLYVHTPIITANDAEGAGNTFNVTTLPHAGNEVDFSKDFFGCKTSLAVTGQLEAETFALAFSKVYTFGPTFRSENSNTKTHAAEFWMVEPEIAFCDLNQLMDIEEDFLKSVVSHVMLTCSDELDFLSQYNSIDLKGRMKVFLDNSIVRVAHKDAISILQKAKTDFQFSPQFGQDLAKEHEKYLTEVHFKSPVFIYNWPKDIKAFYMYQNNDDSTVAAVDLLVPGAGELTGGSQRETRYDKLFKRMEELSISTEEMYWYLNLRKFGGCTHSGFGMGFERLVMYLTGTDNIRDVIPYFRTPQNCGF